MYPLYIWSLSKESFTSFQNHEEDNDLFNQELSAEVAAQKGKGSAGGGSGGSGGKVGGSGVDAGVTGVKGAPDDNHSDISDEESQHEEEEKAADISGTLEFISQPSKF